MALDRYAGDSLVQAVHAMTRAATGNLPAAEHRKIARLMQLHQQTHPERIARRWNITEEYVRRIWSKLPTDEQAALDDVIGILR